MKNLFCGVDISKDFLDYAICNGENKSSAQGSLQVFFERELTNFADALKCYWRQQNSLIRVKF
jgi:hypothetical protein